MITIYQIESGKEREVMIDGTNCFKLHVNPTDASFKRLMRYVGKRMRKVDSTTYQLGNDMVTYTEYVDN